MVVRSPPYTGSLPLTQSEVRQNRLEHTRNNRLRRLLQVREADKLLSARRRETYQRIRREGRQRAVEEARGVAHDRIKQDAHKAGDQLKRALLGLGGGMDSAAIEHGRMLRSQEWEKVRLEEEEEMKVIRAKTALRTTRAEAAASQFNIRLTHTETRKIAWEQERAKENSRLAAYKAEEARRQLEDRKKSRGEKAQRSFGLGGIRSVEGENLMDFTRTRIHAMGVRYTDANEDEYSTSSFAINEIEKERERALERERAREAKEAEEAKQVR